MSHSFKTCPRCQTDVPPDAPLCPRCGHLYPPPSGADAPVAASAGGEKRKTLLWLLAVLFVLVVLVGGVFLLASSDKYPFLGVWTGTMPDQSNAALRLGQDGLAEMNFRYQGDLQPVTQPGQPRRYRWTNTKNILTFLSATVDDKTGFRAEWNVSRDGNTLTLTGIDANGRQGVPLIFAKKRSEH